MDALQLRFAIPTALLLALAAGCSDTHAESLPGSAVENTQDPGAVEDAQSVEPVEVTLADRELAGWQSELLDLSYEAVSAMPLNPHIKNRSRAQERVLITCFELDQPARAARFVEGIENWRKGVGYADLAFYGAEHGEKDEIIETLIERARTLAHPPVQYNEAGEEIREQAWRLDRIKSKIARALLVQGRDEEAALYEANLTESERGRSSDLRAKSASDEDFAAIIARLEAVLKIGQFDEMKNELATNVQVYDRFFGDPERREIVERTFIDGSQKMPVGLRVGMLISMAEFATEHGDSEKATQLVDEAQMLIDAGQWGAEFHVPMLARLAEARAATGDLVAAEDLAQMAWVAFDSGRPRIADVFRAETIRPLAEAYVAMGNQDKARWAYGIALEEGAHNPNSWPRSEDLAESLCSMATHAVEPTEELWAQIRKIKAGLGDPW